MFTSACATSSPEGTKWLGAKTVLLRSRVWRTRTTAPRAPAPNCVAVGLAVKPAGEPDAGDRHVRFDERGWETGRRPSAPSYRAHPRLYHGAAPSEHRRITQPCYGSAGVPRSAL